MSFAAPEGTVLEPSTQYWVVVEGSGGAAFSVQTTDSDAQTGKTGWRIADFRRSRPAGWTNRWLDAEVSSSVKIRVSGYARGPAGPAAPGAPVLTATTPVSVDVSWAAPTDLGSSTAILGYELRYLAGAADPADVSQWVTVDESAGLPDLGLAGSAITTATILGLDAGTVYRVQVRAIGDGDTEPGAWSPSASVTTPEAVPSPAAQVSNFSQAVVHSRGLKTHDRATAFTTGSNADGYRLSDIEVHFRNDPCAGTISGRSGHDVRMYLATGLPSATTVVEELASPATLHNPACGAPPTASTAPPGTVLSPNTTYWLVAEAVSPASLPDGSLALAAGGSGAEDGGGMAGWSVGDNGLFREEASTGAWTWDGGMQGAQSTPLLMRVNAAAIMDLLFESAEVATNKLTLTYNRAISTAAKPAASAFTVTLNGNANLVTSVDISGKQVVLTLTNPAFAGDVLKFSYAKPATNPLQDTNGNQAASLPVQTLNVTARVAAVAITSYPGGNMIYGAGEAIWVSVTFSEPVNVDTSGGRPSIGLDFRTEANLGDQTAEYRAGSGTDMLLFEYRVTSGNMTNGGTAVSANTLALNSGSITTVRSGAAITLTHDGLDFDAAHQVNGSHAAGTRLVSNIDDPNRGSLFLGTHDLAQGFTTGPHETGYILNDVEMLFAFPTGHRERQDRDGAADQHRGSRDPDQSGGPEPDPPQVHRAGGNGAGALHAVLGGGGKHGFQCGSVLDGSERRERIVRLEHGGLHPHEGCN